MPRIHQSTPYASNIPPQRSGGSPQQSSALRYDGYRPPVNVDLLYLYQIIRFLLSQLQNGYPGRQGTAGNDYLRGSYGNDRIFGRGGNDTILGGPGNDFLSGGRGNDRIAGGAGNDTLNGDAGDDLLRDESGFNRIDGGAGHDTLDLSGHPLSSYQLAMDNQGDFRLSRYANGAANYPSTSNIVRNIETFHFRDIDLSAAELAARINGVPGNSVLPLSPAQQQALSDVFSIRGEMGAQVIDRDGNDALSAGDQVIVSGGVTGGEITRFELTADQVHHINGDFGPKLPLSTAEITSLLGGPIPSDFGYYALDTDGSGTLTAGDKLVTFGTFTVNGIVQPQYRTITQSDIDTINLNATSIPEVADTGNLQNRGNPVPFRQDGQTVVPDQRLPAYLDKPFEAHILSNPAQLGQFRSDLGLSPVGTLPDDLRIPSTDFSQNVLVYTIQDAADPNHISQQFFLNNEGLLSSLTLATLMGFIPSDFTRIRFYEVPRTGVQAFASSDPIDVNPATL